ncbi:MAG TPA: FlgD immunoglobulin-like domain containing protein, partial [Bacteroidota bacterium]|nr:FlgD immunoglobulin-like domain containing protein [Bacteroidota bacterium]
GSVTLEVFDFGMNRVRTVVRDAQRSGTSEHDEIWDGRNDAGTLVVNGVYFYRVRVNGGDPAWGKVMVIQ